MSHTHTHTHMHTRMHAYTYTHVHTHKHTLYIATYYTTLVKYKLDAKLYKLPVCMCFLHTYVCTSAIHDKTYSSILGTVLVLLSLLVNLQYL